MPPSTSESEPGAKKAILIVDDHPIFRRGLIALIEAEPGFTVCAQADSVATAVESIRACGPDLVIVDLALDGRDGLDLLKDMKVRFPQVPALVLSMLDETHYGERCLRAGARG